MAFNKPKVSEMNRQVIQKIISFQIREKKEPKLSLSPTNYLTEKPFLFEKNNSSTPHNGFYLPKKQLGSKTDGKKNHHTNNSLDSLPNFRIITNKFNKNGLKPEESNEISQKIKTEVDLLSSKSPKKMNEIGNSNISTNFYPSKSKHEVKFQVILSTEKEISFIIDDLYGKNIKTLKNKILNEIRNHLEEKDYENIASFKTIDKLYLIDYVLNFDTHSLDFLEQRELLKITPIFKEMSSNRRSLRDYEIITILGSGGFSKVVLTRNKSDGKLYALKILDRIFIRKNKKEGIIMNERNIMTTSDNPFLIELFAAFKTKKYLVFVMEWCPGGELFYYLKKKKRMPEEIARFFFIELCLGIQYLHKRRIIYRDLKPENLLFDIDGHLKIADFGLAKPDIDEDALAYSFCGSPEYMSPEMLAREGHDRLVDIYGLGLLLYEMVIGIPPFYSPNFDEIFNSVLTENVKFPSKVSLSPEIKSLISRILMKRPEERLGFINDVQDILNHPWCRKLNIDEIANKKVASPFAPDFFQLYFEPSKDIEEIKFLKDLQFEKNDEVLNEIHDNEENDKGLMGFAFEKSKKLFLKRNFITKTNNTHTITNFLDYSARNGDIQRNKHFTNTKNNNHSTGHLSEFKMEPISSYKMSPLVIFPTNHLQTTQNKLKNRLIQEPKHKTSNSHGYVFQKSLNKIESATLPPPKKFSDNLYNFNKETVLQKKHLDLNFISRKKLTG